MPKASHTSLTQSALFPTRQLRDFVHPPFGEGERFISSTQKEKLIAFCAGSGYLPTSHSVQHSISFRPTGNKEHFAVRNQSVMIYIDREKGTDRPALC